MGSFSRAEKISSLGVLAVLLLGLAVPPTRPSHVSALRQVLPTGDNNAWLGQLRAAIPQQQSDLQIARDNPKDYLLRLGIAITAPDEKSNQAFDSLLRDFPHEPSAYAAAMNASRYQGLHAPNRPEECGLTPETAARSYREREEFPWHKGEANRRRDAEKVQSLLALLDRAVDVDPDNGLFRHRRAICLFAMHRDNEALEAVHQAAVAPKFTRYEDVTRRAVDRLWDARGGFDPIGRSNAGHDTDWLGSRDRAVSRIVAHLAYMRIKNGDTDSGARLAIDEMEIAHRVAISASDTISSITGVARFNIAAYALDPLSGTLEAQRGGERTSLSDTDQRQKRALEFLRSHGYVREYESAKRWMKDCTSLSIAARRHIRSSGPGSVTQYLGVSGLYVQSIHNAIRILAISILSLLLWMAIAPLTLRCHLENLWDRRSALTTVLLAALPLAVFCELIVEGVVDPTRSVSAMMGAFLDTISPNSGFARMLGVGSFHSPALHWSLIAVVVGSVMVGLILARRRTPGPEKRAIVPTAALLPAYAAVLGLVVKDAYNCYLSAYDALGGVDWKYLIAPLVLLVIYSFFRALNCRFSRVPQSGPMTFLATLRHGAALVAAAFATIYSVLLLTAVITGYRTDSLARSIGSREASVIREAIRSPR